MVTIKLIADALTSKTGHKVFFYRRGNMANAVHGEVTVGGDNVPARDLLMAALAGIDRKMPWTLVYEANERSYVLSVLYYSVSSHR